jgi:hypothetical protein
MPPKIIFGGQGLATQDNMLISAINFWPLKIILYSVVFFVATENTLAR